MMNEMHVCRVKKLKREEILKMLLSHIRLVLKKIP